MALIGSERAVVGTVSGGNVAYSNPPTQDIAMLAGALPARATNSITNGSGTVIPAAEIVGGVITRTGPSSNFIDTTDTAAAIISAVLAGLPLAGSTIPNSFSWLFYLRNQSAVQQTLAAGTNVVLANDIIIAANSTLIALVQVTSATVVTITGMLAIYDGGLFGYLPSTMLTQFGSSIGTFLSEGIENKQVSSAGVQPGATAADNVLAAYSLPANSLDGTGNRLVSIDTRGSLGSTGNNKRVKLIYNPSTATVGSTVGGGGTTIADTGTITTNGGGWKLSGTVLKYGGANSNTQLCTSDGAVPGGNIPAPQLATATENAAILIAVTGNATTAASDIVFNQLTIRVSN